MHDYYKPSEVAKKLRVSTETIRNLCRTGKLPHHRIGGDRGTIRIPGEAIDSWLKSCHVANAAPPELPKTTYDNLPGLNY